MATGDSKQVPPLHKMLCFWLSLFPFKDAIDETRVGVMNLHQRQLEQDKSQCWWSRPPHFDCFFLASFGTGHWETCRFEGCDFADLASGKNKTKNMTSHLHSAPNIIDFGFKALTFAVSPCHTLDICTLPKTLITIVPLAHSESHMFWSLKRFRSHICQLAGTRASTLRWLREIHSA